jgi:O-antigen/teichoic acid export membrane protein
LSGVAANSPSLRQLFAKARQSPLFRQILTAVSGTAFAQAINLAMIPIVMRIYGPEAFGVLGTFSSVSMVLIPVAALTWPMAIALPRQVSDAKALVRLSLMVALAIALALGVVLFFWGSALADLTGFAILAPYLMLLPLAMFSGAVLEITQQWLYREQRFRLTAGGATVHALCYNSMRSLAGLVSASAPVLVITTALYHTMYASVLLGAMGLGKGNGKSAGPPEAEPQVAEAALDDGQSLIKRYRDFPLFRAPQVLINALGYNMPTLVLAASFGAVPAGFFALCAQVLSMPTNLMGKSVGDVYYPRVIKAIHAGERLLPLLAKGVAGLGLIGILPFGALMIFGPQMFVLAFGAPWEQAGEFARWLALAEFIGFTARPCTVSIPALNLQGRYLAVEVASTALRIAAALAGAALYRSPVGVVIAYGAANSVISLFVIAMVLHEARRLDRTRCRDDQ